MSKDIRWIQRFSNYFKAVIELESAIHLYKTRTLSKLEKQGLIQCFEYTHELAWNVLKDFLENQGPVELFGSKDVIRKAFSLGLLTEGEVWMEMIKSRNQTSHIYDETIADQVIEMIVNTYITPFQSLQKTLTHLKNKEQKNP